MLSLHSIVDLIPFSNNWKIQVKVIHLWKQKTVGGGETIEMILFDVKGNKFQASVKTELVRNFDPILQEGCSYIFTKFSLLPAVDIIGHIVKICHIEHVNVNGKETEKLCLELRNSDLPDDDLPLAIVDSKYQAMVQAVAGDVMFCHTPKKTIAEVLETKQLLNTIVGKTFLFKIGIRRENILNRHESYPVLKIVTDRNVIYECDPCLCSNETEDTYFGMTPAKRIRAFNGDFAERNDQSSATSSLSSVTNKRMKLDKSG
ncbi:OB-fold-like protein [Raphanus sativus]|nr:OB-fold-like protein [Raphanus sativus]